MMELEIKVMWCKGLSGGTLNFFQKLAVYAAVSITPDDKTLKLTPDEKQEQKTPIDQEGDGNPEWNYTMKFNLAPKNIVSNLRHLSLLFELRTQGQLFGDKEIGEVRVPLKDLVQSVGNGIARLVSYEVRCPDGKHNGVLDFSYKVIHAADLGNSGLDSQFQVSGYEHRYHHQESHNLGESEPHRIQYSNTNCFLGNCVSDSHIQVSSHGHHHHHQESHISNTSEWGRIQYPNNGHWGHSVSDSGIQISGYGYHSHQEIHFSDSSLSSVSERIQYPKVDSDFGGNCSPAIPSPWQPPPAPVHYSPPPPPPGIPAYPPPPRHQQPYAYQPPPYGRPPPNYQQQSGGGYEYPHC